MGREKESITHREENEGEKGTLNTLQRTKWKNKHLCLGTSTFFSLNILYAVITMNDTDAKHLSDSKLL